MKTEIMGIKGPAKECGDRKCPFHGQINVKKEFSEGIVAKRDVNHSATITWERPHYVAKYERYETRRSRMRVHNPACIDAPVGALVIVAKTRPLSKTKDHVIIVRKDKK